MTAEIETSAANEELSITEAALEFGLSEALIRQAVRTGRLPSIPHRFGLRVGREDMARLASAMRPTPRPQRDPAPRHKPVPTSTRGLAGRQQWRKSERKQQIQGIVAGIGAASTSAVHRRLIAAGMGTIPYTTVALTLRQLANEGRLVAEESGRPVTYRLPRPAEEAEGCSPEAVAPPRSQQAPPRPVRSGSHPGDEGLSSVETETLVALRSLGQAANLAEIYEATSSRPVYVEVVMALRSLVKRRLAVRIKEAHRYLYRAAE